MATHNPNYDINITSRTWLIGNPATIQWNAPTTTPDHYKVYHAATWDWTVATVIATISGSALTTTVTPPTDGTANYYWVIGYNAAGTQGGNAEGTEFCQNTVTQTWVNINAIDANFNTGDFTGDVRVGGRWWCSSSNTNSNYTPGNGVTDTSGYALFSVNCPYSDWTFYAPNNPATSTTPVTTSNDTHAVNNGHSHQSPSFMQIEWGLNPTPNPPLNDNQTWGSNSPPTYSLSTINLDGSGTLSYAGPADVGGPDGGVMMRTQGYVF